MSQPVFTPLVTYREYPADEMKRRARDFYETANRRRTVRAFSDRPVPHEVIADCIRTAGTAPSGAHQQPWRFVVVSDPELKHRIRIGAEKEELDFYTHRAPPEWLEALAPLGTDENKSFLDVAPHLIIVFAVSHGISPSGVKMKHYYAQESVGIATGMLITALHHSGLATLTHTPSPMGFLNELLERPSNERPFLNLVVGFPADDVSVPDITRKPLEEIAIFR